MLNVAQKIGSKYFVHVEILKAFSVELEKLPAKEKILFDFRSAIDFLRPFLELALEKNYTKDEIFELMGKVGWNMTRNAFRYFWGLFLTEEENSGRKKNHSEKSSKKSKTETSTTKAQKGKPELSYGFSADTDEDVTQNQDLPVQESDADTTSTQASSNKGYGFHKFFGKSTQDTNNAYFEIEPDTEDL